MNQDQIPTDDISRKIFSVPPPRVLCRGEPAALIAYDRMSIVGSNVRFMRGSEPMELDFDKRDFHDHSTRPEIDVSTVPNSVAALQYAKILGMFFGLTPHCIRCEANLILIEFR